MPPARKTPAKKSNQSSESTAKKTRSAEAVARDEKRRKLWSLMLFLFGVLLIVFSFVGNVNAEQKNATDHINTFLRGMFGFSVFFTGPILIYIAVMISMNKRKGTVTAKIIQLCLILLLISAGIQVIFVGEVKFAELFESGVKLHGGGLLSFLLGAPLMLFGRITASILVILVAFVIFMLASDITLHEFLKIISKPFRTAGGKIKEKSQQYREDSEYLRMYHEENKKLDKEARKENEQETTSDKDIDINKRLKFASIEAATNSVHNKPFDKTPSEDLHKGFREELSAYINDEKDIPESEPEKEPEEPATADEPDAFAEVIEDFIKEEEELAADKIKNEQSLNFSKQADIVEENISPEQETAVYKEPQYSLPPVSILNEPAGTQNKGDVEAELRQNSETLVETLKSFGVQTEIVGHCRGPSVTRYELKPAAGVKISKITSLIDDIALNLATAGVRIEAPIPNKPAVGIEVPNRTTDTVHIRSLIDSEVFRNNDSKLAAVIGMDISGEIIVCDIAKMPHILIAGTTGSGKSVCVNSIIMSILFRSTPEEVRFFMIDPKSVEFMIYESIPHLLAPVVTDSKKAAGTLNTAVKMMTDRYTIFAEYSVRDIFGYNSLCAGNTELERMAQIVIFIDEFADLMMVAPGDVENGVCRLAQMGRAAGIHLVIATQRPSVDVITGIIKANISSRIALKVASQVDSRTIIDSAGAEKLLGKGDMLFFPVGAPKPVRVQGCWVSEKEVEKTAKHIKNAFVLDYDESVIKEIENQASLVGASKSEREKAANNSNDLDISDDKLDEAIEAVIEAGQASTSYLQRKLKLGYGRAARLIDIMEQMGVVGTFEGSKPRQVIMTKQEFYEMKMNKDT